MLVPTKSILRSKTFWLGVATFALALVDFVDLLELPAAEKILVALGPAIILLRQITKQPVTVTGKEAKSITGGVPLGREK